MLNLVLQIGPCRIEPVTRGLYRVRGGMDQPAVIAALRDADAGLDGTGRFWWIEAQKLRALSAQLRRVSDPLFKRPRG